MGWCAPQYITSAVNIHNNILQLIKDFLILALICLLI